jgi:hypothetical protein
MFTKLHLENNALTSLPSEVASFTRVNLVEIHLYGNPWSCDCHTHWTKDWLKSLGNIVVNRDLIACSSDDVRNGRSLSDASDSDFLCHHILSVSEVTWIVAPTVAACVMAVLAAGVVGVYVKRVGLYKRFKWHPFDVEECVGEDMTYDAFLSGAAEDDDAILFVYKELQQRGYTVCYHKLHFQAGVTTLANIENAITHSKRTICYITPSFVQSDWCKFEFECAFSRDLNNKRHRLIAIVDNMNNITAVTQSSSLQQYLET